MSPGLWGITWAGLSTLSPSATPFSLGTVPCCSPLALFHQPAGKWGAMSPTASTPQPKGALGRCARVCGPHGWLLSRSCAQCSAPVPGCAW